MDNTRVGSTSKHRFRHSERISADKDFNLGEHQAGVQSLRVILMLVVFLTINSETQNI